MLNIISVRFRTVSENEQPNRELDVRLEFWSHAESFPTDETRGPNLTNSLLVMHPLRA